jgi:hypothetical protein
MGLRRSGTPGVVTSVIVKIASLFPVELVPRMEGVNIPVEARRFERVRVLLLPGITTGGKKEAVTPGGKLKALRNTGSEKPRICPTTTVV